MKRIYTHRFLIIPALCILTGAGCASQSNTQDNTVPDKIPSAAVIEPSTAMHSEVAINKDSATQQISTNTIAAEPPDTPLKDNAASTDAIVTTDIMVENNAADSSTVNTTPSDAAMADSADPSETDTTVPRPTFEDMHPCTEPIEEAAGWLDRGHTTLYQTVCGTVAWFDGFFGDQNYDAASRQTYGRVSLSGFWDQYNGFDPKFRFRAKFALPTLKNRTSLLVGRGDDRDFIEEQGDAGSSSIPSNFNQVEDESFLLGLGYRRGTGLKKGLDFSVGVKLRVPPEPYIKARFRRAWELSDATLLRVRPILYWKSDEGIGTSLNIDIDHLLSNRFMLRWTSYGNVSQDKDIQGLRWNNWLSLFQALTGRNAISYHVFVAGETKAEVGLQNYGFELRYRKRIARKWLFLELISSLSWPQEFFEDSRDLNIGFGAGLEMYFGPVPDAQLR